MINKWKTNDKHIKLGDYLRGEGRLHADLDLGDLQPRSSDVLQVVTGDRDAYSTPGQHIVWFSKPTTGGWVGGWGGAQVAEWPWRHQTSDNVR